ncbi:MAG: Spy/CpxP family protein refolding chaperone [Deltaproteobacteria bacterium]|nr:Spy/CpxP family protein refolding chaperone [Deltaproteobacteria bacterium]
MKKVAETIIKLILVLTVGRTIGYFLPHIYYQGGTYLGTLASLLSNPLPTATGLIYGLSKDGEKIMKRTLVILSTLLLFTVGTTSVLHAWRGGPEGGMGYGSAPYGAVVLADPNLDLTTEQAAQIHALDEKYLREIKPLKDQLYSKGVELRSAWLQTTLDRININDLQKDVTNLRGQMWEKITAHRLNVLNVLTPEQRAKVQAYDARRAYGSGKGMRGRGGMTGFPPNPAVPITGGNK